MTLGYIYYQMKEHTPDELIGAYSAATEHLRAAPQCLGYDLARCVEELLSSILGIHGTSTADHLEGFRRGLHFPPFLALIRPFIGEITEMRHFERVKVQWQR
jgi:quinol monooxygenase YgiN